MPATVMQLLHMTPLTLTTIPSPSSMMQQRAACLPLAAAAAAAAAVSEQVEHVLLLVGLLALERLRVFVLPLALAVFRPHCRCVLSGGAAEQQNDCWCSAAALCKCWRYTC
jgi:hypothetical protein